MIQAGYMPAYIIAHFTNIELSDKIIVLKRRPLKWQRMLK